MEILSRKAVAGLALVALLLAYLAGCILVDALQQTEALRTRGVSLHLLDLGGDIAGGALF